MSDLFNVKIMKNIYAILLLIIISASCSSNLADKRVHRKGYHFRGLAFKHNTLKSKDNNEPITNFSDVNSVQKNANTNLTINSESQLNKKHLQDSFPRRSYKLASKNRSFPIKEIANEKEAKSIQILNSKTEIDFQSTQHQTKFFKSKVHVEKNELQTKSIVLSSIAGFFTILGSLAFFKRKKVYAHVKAKSVWASNNKAKARWLLGASHLGLLASSLTAGWLLKDMGLGFSSFGMNGAVIGTTAAFIGSRMIGRGKSFTRKKMSFAVMPVTVMLLAIGFGSSNQFSDMLKVNRFEKTSVATSKSNNSQEVSQLNENDTQLEKDNSPRKRDSVTTIIIKTILILLALTLGFLLIYTIAVLSCLLICSELVILGWLLLIVGVLGLIGGLFFLLRYIIKWKKGEKNRDETKAKKPKKKKNNMFKKLFFPILFILGLLATVSYFGLDF